MILVLVEHDHGLLNKSSFEVLTFGYDVAQQQNIPLHAILIGESARPLAEPLSAYGVSTVHLAQDDRLEEYAPAAWAHCVVDRINALQPLAVMAAGTDRGHEVIAHVAARTNLPFAANCTAIQANDLSGVTRLRWGGSLLEEAQLDGSPKLLTVAPHGVQAKRGSIVGETKLLAYTPSLSDADFRVRVTGRITTTSDKISLAESRVVVGGGRGVGSAEGFESLEDLALLIEGAVGCSRAVTSNGWRPHSDQVGQTGTRIAPELYIACGISGAIQHMVACAGAKHILAINTDPDAPILAKADYAVIGDLHQVIPALVKALRKPG